jgi:hypothetical protein
VRAGKYAALDGASNLLCHEDATPVLTLIVHALFEMKVIGGRCDILAIASRTASLQPTYCEIADTSH